MLTLEISETLIQKVDICTTESIGIFFSFCGGEKQKGSCGVGMRYVPKMIKGSIFWGAHLDLNEIKSKLEEEGIIKF